MNMIEFLSNPTLADIVSYLIVLFLFIYNTFIKRFVKKDNILTVTMIKNQFDSVMKSINEKETAWNEEREQLCLEFNKEKEMWQQERQELIKERENWIKEKEEIKKEWQEEKEQVITIQKEQANALTMVAGNQAELVRKGVANKVAKMMNKDGGNENV